LQGAAVALPLLLSTEVVIPRKANAILTIRALTRRHMRVKGKVSGKWLQNMAK